MIELILFGDRAEVDEVSLGRSARDGADVEAQVVVTGWKGLDDMLCFPPAGGLLGRQRDVLFLVQVGDRQVGAGLSEWIFEVTAKGRTVFFKGPDPEFGLLLIPDALLGLTGFEEGLCLLITSHVVTVVGAADLGVGVLFDFPALGPGGGLGRVRAFQLYPVDPDGGRVAVAVFLFEGVGARPKVL